MQNMFWWLFGIGTPLFGFGTPGAKTKKELKCIPVVKKLL